MERALDAQWGVWVAEELLDETPEPEIVAALVANGLDPERAAAEVAAIRASPGFVVAARGRRADRQAVLLRRLLHDHALLAPAEVESMPLDDVDARLASARADHRPAVLRGLARDWPAVKDWTLDALRQRVGHVEVEACFGRGGEAEPDRFFTRLGRRTTLAEVLDAVEAGSGDDVYLIANNAAFPALAAQLLPDLRPPALVSGDLPRTTRFWLGADTFTRLHCDDVDLLFVQILGAKSWWLASPAHGALLTHLLGYYPQFDLRSPPPDVAVRRCVLRPGDALFLPAGWWHQVVATGPSVSTSFVGFPDRNHYASYRPGLPDRAPATGVPVAGRRGRG